MTAQPKLSQNDPRASYLAYRPEIDDAWRRVMDSGRYILGPEVEAFEHEFAAYLGARFAVGTASGTDALQLALKSLGVAAGDAVLTVSHTAVATAAAIVQCGARPLFVDIEPATFTMDANRVEDAITRHRAASAPSNPGLLKAIVPVHLYGHPADMPAITDIARRFELFIVEDCAQSHGAAIRGKNTGTWGDLAVFSFYPTKNLGAFGDGGMIVTGDKDLAEKCRCLREYGWDRDRISQMPGLNSRLDELQAAILCVKLRHLDADNSSRAAVATIYDTLLNRLRLVTPMTRAGVRHAYHQYVVRTPLREPLRRRLREQGIETAVHFPHAVHQQPAFQPYSIASADLTETERAAREVLSLPMYAQLSVDDARHVAQRVNALVG